MPLVSILPDGRVIAKDSTTLVVASSGNYAITVTISDLKTVEEVLQHKPSTDPLCDPGTPVNEKITGNVVGFTMVGVGAGTTLTIEVTAVGM
jgi:hypothetical protein